MYSLLRWIQAHPQLRYASKAADCTDQTETIRSPLHSISSDSVISASYEEGGPLELAASTMMSPSSHPHLMQFSEDISEQEASFWHPSRSWNVDLKAQVFILSFSYILSLGMQTMVQNEQLGDLYTRVPPTLSYKNESNQCRQMY